MLQHYNPKNADLQVYVKDRLIHRDEGGVSVFDSVVQGGDAVWEGLRLYKEGILHLSSHLQRMRESAKALSFENVPSDNDVKAAIKMTLEANGMKDETHLRLTLTRGEKVTSGMDPRLNQNGCTLIVLAEWKALVYDNDTGIKVITSTQRRNGPQFLDSKIHHNNLLNNIIAKIQANQANANAAIMLDDHGFISELNDTNVFMLKDGDLVTPHADACLPGISREMVMKEAEGRGIKVAEKNISLSEFYNADFAFGTGTMGQLTPILEADGRTIGNAEGRLWFDKINDSFVQAIPQNCELL
ncbi:MAG: aminotransferase IV [Bacteroidetes bacterium]|nr:aminotransferase IV [Bacteroidota bacterium]